MDTGMAARIVDTRLDLESPGSGNYGHSGDSEAYAPVGVVAACHAMMNRVKARMKSLYGKRFFQRLHVALRSGWACLFAGVVLQFATPVTDWLAIPFFSLVICLNLVESSLGAVVKNLVGVVIGLGQALSVGSLVYLIFGCSLDLVPTIVIIFFSSFYVAYPAGLLGQEMSRKVALALIGIIFTSAHSGANENSMFFLIRLGATTLFGAGCALLAVIVPFPGLAYWEIKTSAKATVRGDAELFKTNCEAFCAREVSKLSSVFLHAKYLSKTACITLDDLNSRMADVYWELRPLGKMSACKRMSEGLNVIRLHMMGMGMALQSGLILQYTPAKMTTNLRYSLTCLAERSKAMLELTAKMGSGESMVQEKERLLAKAREDLKTFDQVLRIAREESYYFKNDEEVTLGELVTTGGQAPPSPTSEKCIKHLFQSMVPTYFFLFNLKLYFCETMKMLDPNSTGKVANEMHKVANAGGHVPMISYELDKHAVPIAVVVSPVADEASKPPKVPKPVSGLLTSQPTFRCSVCDKQRREEPCVIKDTMIQNIWARVCESFCSFKYQQVVRALKISLAMAIAALAGILYNKKFAFWAVVTVGFIIQNHQGGSFRMANLRLQGTVIGSIYAYLMVIVIHDHPDFVLVALIPWVVVLSYLRFSKLFGAAGVIAGLTAAIVMLGSNGAPIQELAVTRITENFIGVLALIFVESLVFPDRAAILCRKELVSSLVDLRDCVKAVVAAYTGHFCDEHRRIVASDIKKLEAQLRSRIAEQSKLQAEAVMEPELWNVPFPAEIYGQLVNIQTRMLDLLHFMVLSLHAATEECLGSQIRKLVGPLQGSLDALEEEVLSSLHLLQGLLQCTRYKIDLMSKNSGSWHHEAKSELHRATSRHDHGAPNDDLQDMVGKVHPLLVLECIRRDIDGTPLSLKNRMKDFEASYETVVEEFIVKKRADPNSPVLSNPAMLSFSALTFSLQTLLKETVELEKTIHQLLHFEHPWSVLEFWESVDEEKELLSVPPSPGVHNQNRHNFP
ncbi:hypothetical protein MPTK2_2g20340 [Marchantia polymorpha subsp. ruderalis]